MAEATTEVNSPELNCEVCDTVPARGYAVGGIGDPDRVLCEYCAECDGFRYLGDHGPKAGWLVKAIAHRVVDEIARMQQPLKEG